MASSESPIVLITGANAGLGFEVVKALLNSSKVYTIFLSGRSLDKAQAAVQMAREDATSSRSDLEAIQLDIESDDSIEKATRTIETKYGHLDILLNNAGGQFDQQYYAGHMSMREMWNKSWSVNTTSTQMVTHAFVPLLLKSSAPRLVFVTSGTSTLAGTDNLAMAFNKAPAKGWPKQGSSIPAYRSSKTGMNMMMREWSRILREDGVRVCCVSPGYLATGLGGDQAANKAQGAVDPSIGANVIKGVLEGKRDNEVGKVIRINDVQPW